MQKKRGRPKGEGRQPLIAVRITARLRRLIDESADKNGKSRSEAIRDVLEREFGIQCKGEVR